MSSVTAKDMLYHRFTSQGTLSEPDGVPEPRFALQGAVNWMRALSILVDDENITWDSMVTRYKAVSKAKLSDTAINTVFEQLLMSLHHLAAIKAMVPAPNPVDLARSAIVTWYYGIYHAASAMIAAKDGSYQDNHNDTANAWDRQFSETNIAPRPFNYRVTTMVKKSAEAEISVLRSGNTFDLNTEPTNVDQAFGACLSYLKGSIGWRVWAIEQELKRKELKKLGLTDFRKKEARKLRDDRLQGRTFGFVHQASRYRGKANYREALFISYGGHVKPFLEGFYDNLFSVLTAYLCMSAAYSAKRIGKPLWNGFIDDVCDNSPLSLDPMNLWKKSP